jgi:Tfp pilus assembly protein PilO
MLPMRALLRRHGALLVVGAALLLLAGICYAAAVHPLREELAELRGRAEAQQQKLRSGALAAAPARASVEEQLRTFHAFFPRAESAPLWLETLHALGEGYGLQIRSGEYRLERRPDSQLLRYHVTLPVSGSYTQVRQFITHVLQDMPAASLDDVQLRRDPAVTDRVEARLRFSLHFAGT